MTTLQEIFSDDPGPFLSWVKSKPANEHIGYTNSSVSCPLYTFAAARTGQFVRVRKDDIARMDGTPLMPLPQWAQNFIRVADGAWESRLTTENVRHLLGMLGYSSSQFR